MSVTVSVAAAGSPDKCMHLAGQAEQQKDTERAGKAGRKNGGESCGAGAGRERERERERREGIQGTDETMSMLIIHHQ